MPRVRANGIELEYRAIGEGRPLVLVMGIGAQLIHWRDEFCEQLAARDFRVIRFDNRDVGLSSKLDDQRVASVRPMVLRALAGLPVRAPYTLVDMADDIAGLLDALDIERAHIVGASMGGMIAQTMALAHPHRTTSLTSIMSHTGERLESIGHPRALAALLRPSPRSRSEAMDRAEEFYRTVGSRSFPLDVKSVRERAAMAFERSFYPAGFLRHMAAVLASGSRRQALRYVRAPTLVVHGSADPLIRPPGGRATARAIPGARLLMIDGMGHDLPRGAWPRIIDGIAQLAERAEQRRPQP
jgi:pimeloyl-ACP methyl ester carboxylesterase